MHSKLPLRLLLSAASISCLMTTILPAGHAFALDVVNHQIIIDSDYTLTSDMVFSGSGFLILSSDITLDLGGHTISNASGIGSGVVIAEFADGVTVKNGIITGFYSGISAGGDDSRVMGISVSHTVVGIDGWDTNSGSVIKGNTISALKDTDGGPHSMGIYIRGAQNQVLDNSITDAFSGISLAASSNSSVVKGNKLARLDNAGIGDSGHDNQIVGNTVTESATSIQIWGYNSEVRGNDVSGATRQGIAVYGHDHLIVGNKVTDSAPFGISLAEGFPDGGVPLSENNIVKDNDVSACFAAGIGIGGDNNEVVNNWVSDSNKDGIDLVYDATGNVIKGNSVRNCGSHGIAAMPVPPQAPSGADAPSGNTIEGNNVRASGLFDLFDWSCDEGGDPANFWFENKYKTDNF